jgi:ABC-type multidrug transport system ATPase subunit
VSQVHMTEIALVRAEDCAIGTESSALLSGLSFCTHGDRLFIAGNSASLLSALTLVPEGASQASLLSAQDELIEVPPAARVIRGAMSVMGYSVGSPDYVRWVGAVPLDPPLVLTSTVAEHLRNLLRLKLAARGESMGGSEQTARVDEVLARAGLPRGGSRQLKTLSLPERRVLAIAGGMVSLPKAVVVNQPLWGLEGQGAEYVRGALEAASHIGRLIVSGTTVSPDSAEGAFARGCSDFLFLGGTETVLFGAPDEVLGRSRTFRVTVRSNGAALRSLLEAKGATTFGGSTHFTVGGSTELDVTLVLRAAHEVRSPVVEVLPLM